MIGISSPNPGVFQLNRKEELQKEPLPYGGNDPYQKGAPDYQPPYDEGHNLEEDPHFPPTVFIDKLTTTKEIVTKNDKQLVPDEAAAQRIQALRNMRFKPHVEYARQRPAELEFNRNPANTYTQHHGVRFLKPQGYSLTFAQTDFTSPNIKVINHGFFKRIFRAIAILLTLPFFGRPLFKSTRIEEGEFGYAKDADGNIEIYNSGKGYQTGLSLWTNIQKTSIDSDYVNIFNRVHLIKVKEGEYALGELNGHPVVLPPGRHLIESPQFTLKTAATVKGESVKPHFFKHTDSVVKYNNTHIIRVPPGKVARANLGGRIVILEPEYSDFDRVYGTGIGAYVVHDQNFELLPADPENRAENRPENRAENRPENPPINYFHDINKSLVDLDPARVLTVPQTKAAVVEHNGNKIFLRGGRYALPDATYVYNPTIKVANARGQQVDVDAMYDLTDRLVTISTANDTPLMSNDKIRLQIEASLLFTVVNVEACELKVGVTDYIENTKQRARNKLYELVSKGNYLQPIAGKNQPSNQASSSREVTTYNEEFARRQITADFANQVYEELSRELDQSSGIRLEKVLITSLIIQDPIVRTQVESEATQAASANAALSAAKISQETAVITSNTDKLRALILAQQEAEQLLISTKSKTEAQVLEGTTANRVMLEKAKAELEVSERKAQTEAANIIALAEANKKAELLRADGLNAYQTPFSQQVVMGDVQAKVTNAITGKLDTTFIGRDVGDLGLALGTSTMFSAMGKVFNGTNPKSVTVDHQTVDHQTVNHKTDVNANKQKLEVN
jgi:hypothetical protein